MDLVAHLLHPHDERVEEPKAFSLFVQAQKYIKFESELVQIELVKDMIDAASTHQTLMMLVTHQTLKTKVMIAMMMMTMMMIIMKMMLTMTVMTVMVMTMTLMKLAKK